MDISKLSEREKSVMLARVMGWGVKYGSIPTKFQDIDALDIYITDPESQWTFSNLYDPVNMGLAWKCLNWAWNEDIVWDSNWRNYIVKNTSRYHIKRLFEVTPLWTLSPDKAQAAWLDRILELAIEAGLVELPDTEEE